MSFQILNVDLDDLMFTPSRNYYVLGKYLHSIDIDQTNGTYITTEPLASPNCLTQYPLNPNNTNYTIKTVTTILGSLEINFPLDAKIDHTRNRLWIADAGNNRVLILDSRDFSFIGEAKNISLPHALAIDLNTGNCFVKAYNSVTNGVVLEVSLTGKIVSFFEFSTVFPYMDLTVQRNSNWVESLKKTHSITYDHVSSKVWWVDGTFSFMAETISKTISIYDLSTDGFYGTRNILIDMNSGNAFVLASNISNRWYIVQLNKHNAKFLGKAFVRDPDVFSSSSTCSSFSSRSSFIRFGGEDHDALAHG